MTQIPFNEENGSELILITKNKAGTKVFELLEVEKFTVDQGPIIFKNFGEPEFWVKNFVWI